MALNCLANTYKFYTQLVYFSYIVKNFNMTFLTELRTLLKVMYYSTQQGIVERNYRTFGKRRSLPEEEDNIEGQVVVITGGNRGIGKASAFEFAKRKAIVVLGVRNMQKGLETVEEIKIATGNENSRAIHLDLTDLDSIEKFAVEVARSFPQIKILLNNAGIGAVYGDWAQQKTKEGFNLHVAVNYLGHFLLTNLLLDNLKRAESARVVAVSSYILIAARLDLNDLMMEKSGPGFLKYIPYANTKFANALFIKELGERLKNTNVTTYTLCPGVVKTEIWDSIQDKWVRNCMKRCLFALYGFTKEEAASEFVMYCALNKKISKETGFMYKFRKHLEFANRRLQPELRKNLWELSAQLVQLNDRLKSMRSLRDDV